MDHTHDIDAETIAYLRELAVDIANHGGLNGATMAEAIQAAHDRRQAFVAEMAQCETKRARMAREALAAAIWTDVHTVQPTRRAIARCDAIYG